MQAGEVIKKTIERIAGTGHGPRQLAAGAIRRRRPQTFRFESDDTIPNNPALPLICYRKAIRLNEAPDPAASLADLFARNGWVDSWRDGIYGYAHFHSAAHEVLGIACGHARVKFGGDRGKILTLATEDVVVLPAGTGHQRLSSSEDLLVVGAYPAGSHYDECRPSGENCAHALRTIRDAATPAKDPVYGESGPLLDLWGV
ncbi:MAG TPA: cupin [Xanthobacteraceae bacterium]|jgi:uncharacterized protein YjlB|nr:cupin [Xanthobacteraceae bacterium]